MTRCQNPVGGDTLHYYSESTKSVSEILKHNSNSSNIAKTDLHSTIFQVYKPFPPTCNQHWIRVQVMKVSLFLGLSVSKIKKRFVKRFLKIQKRFWKIGIALRSAYKGMFSI